MAASHTGARKTVPGRVACQRSLITEGPAREHRKDLMMSRIWVVDQQRRPLMPTTPARARVLLKSRKAAILRRFPLVLILKEARPEAVVEPLRIKLDPGSKTSGIAVVNERAGSVLWAAGLTHRSQAIHTARSKRRAARRSRRNRYTRYRAARFANRRRPKG